MKPILNRLIKVAFLIAFLGSPLITSGTSVIHLDGHAKLHFRFCYQELVGYTMDVSSNIPPCLVVYNIKTRSIVWQRRIEHVYSDLNLMPDGTLFMIDMQFLYQVNIQDGVTLRTIDLESLSWPITTRPKNPYILKLEEAEESLSSREMTKEVKDYLLKLGETKRELTAWLKWRTQFTLEQITPTLFFIQRRSHSGLGGFSAIMTEDWIIYNFTNNNIVQSGLGAKLAGRGASDEIILYDSSQDYDRLFTFKNGASLNIGKILSTDHPDWRLGSQSKLWTGGHSHDKRYLINFEQQIENDNTAGIIEKEHYAIYDSRTNQLAYLELEPVKEYYTHLVLQKTNLVRYSYYASSETNPAPLYIESFDFRGNSIAKITFPGAAQNRLLRFQGRTTQDDLIFTDFISAGGTDTENHYTVTGCVFVVEVPSLRIKANHKLPATQGLGFKAVSDTDQTVQVEGNIDIQFMKTDSLPHQFIVRCLDVYSGKELWRFKKDVVIQKQKNP